MQTTCSLLSQEIDLSLINMCVFVHREKLEASLWGGSSFLKWNKALWFHFRRMQKLRNATRCLTLLNGRFYRAVDSLFWKCQQWFTSTLSLCSHRLWKSSEILFLFWLIFCFTEHKKSKGFKKSVTAKRKIKVSSTIALSCQKWKLCYKLWGSGKYNYKCGTKTTIHWHVNQRLVQQVLYLIKKEKKMTPKNFGIIWPATFLMQISLAASNQTIPLQ